MFTDALTQLGIVPVVCLQRSTGCLRPHTPLASYKRLHPMQDQFCHSRTPA